MTVGGLPDNSSVVGADASPAWARVARVPAMTNLARFAALAGRLDAALTAELIMVPTPLLQLTEQEEEARVAGEMDETTYDVLPRDRLISSYWVRAHLVA